MKDDTGKPERPSIFDAAAEEMKAFISANPQWTDHYDGTACDCDECHGRFMEAWRAWLKAGRNPERDDMPLFSESRP